MLKKLPRSSGSGQSGRSTSLMAPFLPQMADDGLITSSDLLAENVIYVEIKPYQTAAANDFINLYFQGQGASFFAFITDPLGDLPVVYKIDAEGIPDGVYSVYYTVTDVAGNISHSLISYAILIRNGTGNLPPPVFTDAVNNVIDRGNILTQGGTHIFIPVYPQARGGDRVSLSFWMTDDASNDVDGAAFTHTRVLTTGEAGTGFTVLVPERYLLLVNSGEAFATYAVVRVVSGETDTSFTAAVRVSIDAQILLPPPYYPDSQNGELSGEGVAGGIRIALSYDDMAADDEVDLMVRGFDTGEQPVAGANDHLHFFLSGRQATAGEAVITFDESLAELVINGWFDSGYTVTRNGQTRISAAAAIRFRMEDGILLPAPTFVSATGGVLTSQQIVAENGTPLQVTNNVMLENDVVTAYLSGYLATGEVVPAAGERHVRTVTPAEQAQGSLSVMLSLNALLAVGDGGRLSAYYTVQPADLSTIQQSFNSEVTMSGTDVPQDLDMLLSSGAPPLDTDTVDQVPCNHGLITGQPGSLIQITTDETVTILESGSDSHSLSLDQNGQGRFRITSDRAQVSTLVAINTASPAQEITAPALFSNYRVGEGDIRYVATTTGAAADGLMPCSVYLITEPSTLSRVGITTIRVTITNSATAQITGYPGLSSAFIPLKADKSVEIDITNTVAEPVLLQITLPESSGTVQNLSVAFLPPPGNAGRTRQ